MPGRSRCLEPKPQFRSSLGRHWHQHWVRTRIAESYLRMLWPPACLPRSAATGKSRFDSSIGDAGGTARRWHPKPLTARSTRQPQTDSTTRSFSWQSPQYESARSCPMHLHLTWNFVSQFNIHHSCGRSSMSSLHPRKIRAGQRSASSIRIAPGSGGGCKHE